MNNFLLEHNLLTGLIWEPDEPESYGRNYQQWLGKIRRTHSQLVYSTSNGELLKAYAEKAYAEFEPLAIHIKTAFGDGIYYFSGDTDLQKYFVVINKEKVISGSDRFVTSSFFSEIISEINTNELDKLSRMELSQEWLESIAVTCKQRKIVMQRKQKLFAIGGAIAAVILVITVAVVFKFMLS